MTPRHSVAVRILGKEYRVLSEGEDEFLQRVARLVDETMLKIRERTGAVDSLDVAVLAALNLSRELVSAREGRPQRAASGVEAKRLRQLTDLVESEAPALAPEAR